jgi:hypothetical protein
MKCDDIPSQVDWDKYRELAVKFDLDTESVFKADFWNEFTVFINRARELG